MIAFLLELNRNRFIVCECVQVTMSLAPSSNQWWFFTVYITPTISLFQKKRKFYFIFGSRVSTCAIQLFRFGAKGNGCCQMVRMRARLSPSQSWIIYQRKNKINYIQCIANIIHNYFLFASSHQKKKRKKIITELFVHAFGCHAVNACCQVMQGNSKNENLDGKANEKINVPRKYCEYTFSASRQWCQKYQCWVT